MQQFEAKEIGGRIAAARKEAGLTQDELADMLNVSRRSMQDYEAGETIPYKYFRRLEEILKKPLGWFLHGEQESYKTVTYREAEQAEEERELALALRQVPERLDRVEAELRGIRAALGDGEPSQADV